MYSFLLVFEAAVVNQLNCNCSPNSYGAVLLIGLFSLINNVGTVYYGTWCKYNIIALTVVITGFMTFPKYSDQFRFLFYQCSHLIFVCGYHFLLFPCPEIQAVTKSRVKVPSYLPFKMFACRQCCKCICLLKRVSVSSKFVNAKIQYVLTDLFCELQLLGDLPPKQMMSANKSASAMYRYAVTNLYLTRFTEKWKQKAPQMTCTCIR